VIEDGSNSSKMICLGILGRAGCLQEHDTMCVQWLGQATDLIAELRYLIHSMVLCIPTIGPLFVISKQAPRLLLLWFIPESGGRQNNWTLGSRLLPGGRHNYRHYTSANGYNPTPVVTGRPTRTASIPRGHSPKSFNLVMIPYNP
jgi:hypothetical protein